jgi:hypothetical protein
MRFHNARQKVGEAIGGAVAPIAAGQKIDRPTLKRLAGIIIAGLVLVTVTSNLDAKVRGAWPVIIAGGTILTVIAYVLRSDRRVMVAVVATWPVVAVVAFALTDTPATVDHAANLTGAANAQTMLRADQLADLGPKITEWGFRTALPWGWQKVGEGLAALKGWAT